jgi:cobalt-zinc-cadmium efflux system membrane fusion protein
MKNKFENVLILVSVGALLAGFSGCNTAQGDTKTQTATPAIVVPDANLNLFAVDHPEQFPLTQAAARSSKSEMVVTGNVSPDVSRNVPVVSLASGRVVEIHARLGDTVKKGQLLLTIRSDDVSGGYANYRKAIADELLSRNQLERSQDLYNHGAIALSDLQIAQDTEDKAKVDLETLAEHLKLLGNDPSKPAGMVDIHAPVSGVITDQEVTNASAVQAFGSPSPFIISDLSSVWILCDVYENDLPSVRVGDLADVTLNAYPGRVFEGRVNNIGATLDPNIRTAKVRIEVKNPGIMRLGMFVKATFRGQSETMHTVIPATAVLHMHDRDFVFVPTEEKNKFRRLEVVSGDLLAADKSLQEIQSGLKPGQQVVSNALVLDHVLAQ